MRILKEYNILIDGKPYKVELVKHDEGSPFLVKVNEKPYEVEIVSKIDLKAPFSLKVFEKPYNIELNMIDRRAPFTIKVNDTFFKVELETAVKRVVSQAPELPTVVSVIKPSRKVVEEGVVVAPMAGKIVSVRVKKGDSVKVGDVLCILEAMKMENEITAAKLGMVQEVRVSEGMPVNEGDILIVIK